MKRIENLKRLNPQATKTASFKELFETVEKLTEKKLVFVYNPNDYLCYSFWLLDADYKMGLIDKFEIDPCWFAHTLTGGLTNIIRRINEDFNKGHLDHKAVYSE